MRGLSLGLIQVTFPSLAGARGGMDGGGDGRRPGARCARVRPCGRTRGGGGGGGGVVAGRHGDVDEPSGNPSEAAGQAAVLGHGRTPCRWAGGAHVVQTRRLGRRETGRRCHHAMGNRCARCGVRSRDAGRDHRARHGNARGAPPTDFGRWARRGDAKVHVVRRGVVRGVITGA